MDNFPKFDEAPGDTPARGALSAPTRTGPVADEVAPAFGSLDVGDAEQAAEGLEAWLASGAQAPGPFPLRPGETVVDARQAVASALTDFRRYKRLLASRSPMDRRAEGMLRVRADDLTRLHAVLIG